MIVFEERLAELLNTLPNVEVNNASYPVYFNWGTKEVLNKYLSVTQGNAYPLIWLVDGTDEQNVARKEVARNNTRLILAINKASVDLFNPDWYQSDYKNVLNPLAENVIKALDRSSISRLSNDYQIQRFPNYTENGEENATVDVWNALTIDCDITFNNNCLKPFKYE